MLLQCVSSSKPPQGKEEAERGKRPYRRQRKKYKLGGDGVAEDIIGAEYVQHESSLSNRYGKDELEWSE